MQRFEHQHDVDARIIAGDLLRTAEQKFDVAERVGCEIFFELDAVDFERSYSTAVARSGNRPRVRRAATAKFDDMFIIEFEQRVINVTIRAHACNVVG